MTDKPPEYRCSGYQCNSMVPPRKLDISADEVFSGAIVALVCPTCGKITYYDVRSPAGRKAREGEK